MMIEAREGDAMGKYFTIAEMVRSDTAQRQGIDNTLPKDLLPNVQALIDNVLDPVREWYGKPIRVTSGYRCDALNRAVGGVSTSLHRTGQAADIVGTPDTKEENQRLFAYIRDNMDFYELIDESNYSWVHVGYKSKQENIHRVSRL